VTHPSAPLIPRSRLLFVAALAVLAVGLLQLAHVIELPFGAWFSGAEGSLLSPSRLNDFMRSWGYPSLFALMALESASLPVPSEVVLPFAGVLVSSGVLNFWLVLAVSTVASLTGALVDYYLALWLGRPFVTRMLKLFRVHGGALERAESWFDTSGRWTVFLARFVPVLRTVISLPAGLFRMDIKSFILMTVVGCLGWSAVLVYAGVLAGNAGSSWQSAFSSSRTLADGLSAVAMSAAAAYIAYYIYGWMRKTRNVTSPQPSVS
jgi:membrane protein DedA with SNARE-associated domain